MGKIYSINEIYFLTSVNKIIQRQPEKRIDNIKHIRNDNISAVNFIKDY